MKLIKYFFQYLLIIFSFLLFKILGPNLSSSLSGKIFEIIGPFFRSEKIIHSNIKKAISNIDTNYLKKITKLMWNNYGRTFAEYLFIKDFRFGSLKSNVEIEGQDVLNQILKSNKQVIFISGHLGNFELMAMYLDSVGVNLCAIYRPLNNVFLNGIMEKIRKTYICKNQIKKGIGGLKQLMFLKRKNYSTALMIDQRVSQGILSDFFGQKALTTTIPAQLVKKFKTPIVPIYIERVKNLKFKITINQPIVFAETETTQDITDKLNKILEKMILNKPEQWIWSHNRWK